MRRIQRDRDGGIEEIPILAPLPREVLAESVSKSDVVVCLAAKEEKLLPSARLEAASPTVPHLPLPESLCPFQSS